MRVMMTSPASTELSNNDIAKILLTEKKALENISLDNEIVFSMPKILLVGNSVVGKSSIFNRIAGQFLSEVSPIPQEYEAFNKTNWASSMTFIDSPSYNPDKLNPTLLKHIKNADIVIHVCSIGASILRVDKQLTKLLSNIRGDNRSHIVALNKCDLYIGESRDKRVEQSRALLKRDVIPVSTKSGEGLVDLISSAINNLPREKSSSVLYRVKQFGQQITNEETIASRKLSCRKIILESLKEASNIGASKDPSGARLLALHASMIGNIAEQFKYNEFHGVTPYSFDSYKSFFFNSVLQALKDYIPRDITASHAIVWTESIGNYAIEYFDKLTNNVDNSQISAQIRDIVYNNDK